MSQAILEKAIWENKITDDLMSSWMLNYFCGQIIASLWHYNIKENPEVVEKKKFIYSLQSVDKHNVCICHLKKVMFSAQFAIRIQMFIIIQELFE